MPCGIGQGTPPSEPTTVEAGSVVKKLSAWLNPVTWLTGDEGGRAGIPLPSPPPDLGTSA